MPQTRNSATPPPVMTWTKTAPVLVVAFIFDVVRLVCEQLWFFGPALAAAYCTAKVSGAVGTTVGTIVGGTLCSATAVAAGVVGAAAIEATGVIMAMAVGLFSWLVIGLWLVITNRRIFEENSGNLLWFVGGLFISELPIIGSLPAITTSVWRMYHTQIQKEKADLKKWEAEQKAQQAQEQQQQMLIAQMRDTQPPQDDIY
jgi:hypothetical protein